ncbi:MAG: hypothetical protein IJ405_00570 [Lachnospiraceae bacterium]|nr:hypothetical protein [Lachnospiraceae bacterium]MBQ9134924.1 hypothetical protein [Lachnospiraceae bacterium]
MVKKGIKVLTGIALALQVLGIVLTFLIVTNQRLVMEMLGGLDVEEIETMIFPVTTIATKILPLIAFGIFCIVVFSGKPVSANGKVAAVVSFALYGTIPMILSYISRLETMYLARNYGMMVLAGYSTIDSAIALVCSPLVTGAFALFGLAAGGYIWSESNKTH